MPTIIYLVRHGKTDWSEQDKHTGLTDIPLNAEGKKQALHLKQELEKTTFSKVFSSPLIRAFETCKLAGFSSRAEINPDLVEWDYGDYEGFSTPEIRQTRPQWSLFKDGVENGETFAEISIRAHRVLEKVKNFEGNVLLFSSAHFLRVLTACFLGLSVKEGRLFLLSPASVSILGYERENPVILLWNFKTA
jgi:broad specificity phosphatase PhoE